MATEGFLTHMSADETNQPHLPARHKPAETLSSGNDQRPCSGVRGFATIEIRLSTPPPGRTKLRLRPRRIRDGARREQPLRRPDARLVEALQCAQALEELPAALRLPRQAAPDGQRVPLRLVGACGLDVVDLRGRPCEVLLQRREDVVLVLGRGGTRSATRNARSDRIDLGSPCQTSTRIDPEATPPRLRLDLKS